MSSEFVTAPLEGLLPEKMKLEGRQTDAALKSGMATAIF